MRTQKEHAEINRMLGNHGLPQLESGSGLIQALAFLVEDHSHLRSLLIRCPPENRSEMYDAMRPYLHFTPRPLDSYVSESAEKAEAGGLPTLRPDGSLKWPGVVHSIESDAASAMMANPDVNAAQEAVNYAFARQILTVTCRSCMRVEQFSGDTKDDCVLNARQAGWVHFTSDATGKPVDICPDCPATRKA
jgi:hypothetical protein